MLFVKVMNAAESRYIPVEDTRKIDQILSNPNGKFEVECDASGTPIIYDSLHVKRVCNDKHFKRDTSVVTNDADILSRIQAAAQAKQMGAAPQSSAPVAENKPEDDNKVAPELRPISGAVAPTYSKKK